MGGTVPVLLSGPADTGKQELFAKGMQGGVRIAGVIGVDGRLHGGRIASSSRSSEVDAFALSLVAQSTFGPAKDKTGQVTPVLVTIPIFLWKDSLADGSIFAKRCADFVVDADWHAKAFPEQEPDQLRSWLLLSGATFAYRAKSGAKQTASPTFQSVYDTCRLKPSRKFADVFLRK